MGRSRKSKPFYEGVTITDIGAEGKAIARVEDLVVFTTHVVPGDVVDLQVTKKRKNYAEARVVRILEKSTDRVDAFCEHFGVCGGCKWQYLPYQKQLFYKQKQVADQLLRLGRIHLPEISPILGSAKQTYYRNKLEFSFSNKRWLTPEEIGEGTEPVQMNALGFHIPGLFDKIIDIDTCWLQPAPSNELRNFIRSWALEHQLDFFDIRNQQGFLRNMIVRTASTGENMLIVAFYYEDKSKREALLQAVANEFPELTSIMYVINSKANDTITDQDIHVFHGRDHIFEEMEGLRFKIGPKSFYQTNSGQAYELYKVAREFAELTGNEVVYDLYTGTGTIANFVANRASKVVGIEYVPEAIEDAKVNSTINNIENTTFFAGDMKEVLNGDFIRKHGHPDVIITDPPRAGMHDDVVNIILDAAPQRIVYVSCNPATQARDLSLMDAAYEVKRVQPVDMFPHTHHVENVVQLIRRES
ncbi:23S rRNA (uracil(1939)-C(5))-methyltransferase RlmD [Gaoshiqia sediminis]|uniref:23S rRNA (Uracil(1939)-C(5))-methyltransferase RlmD n=1 Tax=Gaoshiqia sediminis TaxID=2986998 RepID=A0AA42C5V0_9BACT|nr:23S rRNA (uracil(1939)-C(5))-methyltransferase RlmD [Gaoshiqia sediminis]MCW0481909.1 23S rRNA (uracil(1939)-C(5))-methyltransferase RlmD [Gaoshiqia sediminis]